MAIRLGIIGAGSIGDVHARAAGWAGSTVVAVCDADRERAKRFVSGFEGVLAFDSLDEFLAREDMEAVVVATPNHLHKPLAVAALAAGKDVLLEKPMAMTVGECSEIIDSMRHADRLVQIGFVSRFAPGAIAVKKLIDEGTLGTIYHAKAFTYRRRGIPGLGKWFTTKAKSGGGALIDIGVHLIDLVLHLTGYPEPVRISAAGTSRFGSPIDGYRFSEMWAGPPDPSGTFDVDDGLTSLCRFADGMTFELNVTWAANLPENTLPDGLVLLGDKGGCALDHWNNRLTLTTQEGFVVQDVEVPLDTTPHDNAWDRAWHSEHEYFAQAVETRTEPHPSAQNGVMIQRIIEAMYASSDAGREVELS